MMIDSFPPHGAAPQRPSPRATPSLQAIDAFEDALTKLEDAAYELAPYVEEFTRVHTFWCLASLQRQLDTLRESQRPAARPLE